MEFNNNCTLCNNQKILNEKHVRNIDGELVRLCPICYKSMCDCKKE